MREIDWNSWRTLESELSAPESNIVGWFPNDKLLRHVLLLMLIVVLTKQKVTSGILALPLLCQLSSSNCSLLQYLSWIVLWSTESHNSIILAISAIVTLVAVDKTNLSLVPAFIRIYISDSNYRVLSISRVTFAFMIVAIGYHQYICAMETWNESTYYPTFGITWYLQAVAFTEYKLYFAALLSIIQTVATFIVALCLKDCSRSKSIAVKLIILTNILFMQRIQLMDILIPFIVLLEHDLEFRETRYPLLTMSLFIFAIIISPWLFDVWISTGTGNANFLFFSSFASWVALALFLIEFVSGVNRMEEMKPNN